jgi:uncharacterized protein (UPF0335 family)
VTDRPYDPYAPRKRGKSAAAGDDTETTVTIRLPDGTETPPATLSQLREATEAVKRSRGAPARSSNVAHDQLRVLVERIERLEEEKKTIADDIKDVYGEAKGTGFDTKALRKLIAIRKLDPDTWREQSAILDTYLHALGMLPEGDE